MIIKNKQINIRVSDKELNSIKRLVSYYNDKFDQNVQMSSMIMGLIDIEVSKIPASYKVKKDDR